MSLLPGFKVPVHDAQQAFRQLLTALARPGQIQSLETNILPPTGFSPAVAAAGLTLFDLETTVWAAPDISTAVTSWWAFHTGYRRAASPQSATFAVMTSLSLPDLKQFGVGTALDPESSTTLLIAVPAIVGGNSVTIAGPGIVDRLTIAPQIPKAFWQWWTTNHRAYPLGVDVFLLAPDAVLGLPRSVGLQSVHESR